MEDSIDLMKMNEKMMLVGIEILSSFGQNLTNLMILNERHKLIKLSLQGKSALVHEILKGLLVLE